MAVPMIAGGELIGALSFGGAADAFAPEQIGIAQETATQLAIAMAQARLLERVRGQAAELEAKVRERTAELEDLYNNAPCGYHSVNKDGLFERMNDTELRWLGYTREEVIGKIGPRDLHTPESLKIFLERFEHFKETGVSQNTEYEFRRKDGTLLPVVLNATSIRDRDGNFVMSRSTIFDNTARKRAEVAVLALNKELESFSYSVSHDLRAPLRAVDGYARMLEEDYGGRLDEEGRRLLAVVRDSAKRMGQLIDDLLAFSRLGRQDPVKREVDMAALAREVIDELARGARKGIELTELPPAQADRALFKQVWANLIGNALKYSGKRADARIEVGGRRDAAENVYWVRDNGVGFDMRYVDKLFGVFQRLHGADEFPGTGVGLAIVQRVVARHGGRVWAEGRPGEGACFYFSLPTESR
jgi:PAS domain S-box-containing protein